MQLMQDDGTARALEPWELDALQAAQQAHKDEQERRGVYEQYSREDALDRLLAAAVNQIEVPVADAVKMRGFYPAWESGAEYRRGFRLSFADSLWTVLQDHTSQDDWTPFTAPSLYAKVLTRRDEETGEPMVSEWEQPTSENAYNQGDRVTYGGKVYVSTIANNVWSPEAYPQGWEVVEDGE